MFFSYNFFFFFFYFPFILFLLTIWSYLSLIFKVIFFRNCLKNKRVFSLLCLHLSGLKEVEDCEGVGDTVGR